MLLDIVTKGSTDRSVELLIIDATDGTPETGVVYNTSGIDLWYRREGAAKVSITEATLAALTTAHADGGFLHVSDGVYRLDVPDAAFATGANYVTIGGTVTGMVVIGGRVRLTDADFEQAISTVGDIADGVRTELAVELGAVIDIKTVTDLLPDAGALTSLATAAALATVDGVVDAILLDTAEIGAAGAGLTNINLPNQTMDIVGNITGNLSGSVGSVTAMVDANIEEINGVPITGDGSGSPFDV
jgi:hypothetical protein